MPRLVFAILFGLALAAPGALAQGVAPPSNPPAALKPSATRGDIGGAVTDSSTGQPLPTIEVAVKQGARFIAGTFTDAFGRYTIHNLAPGGYTVGARIIGYRSETRDFTIEPGREGATVDFRLVPVPLELARVEVSATSPSVVDVRSGDQRFQSDEYHGAPTTTTSQVMQQSMAGAARAPTGEVHIRGQHAEYTYYVDGVPVTSGVSGSLNEVFDPGIIDQISFKTGSWDAEYGNKNAAIVDVATRIPTGGYHLDLSGYGGSFKSNGLSFIGSANGTKFGAVLSGSSQVTDIRREPVMGDPVTNEPFNFHNHGDDQSLFAKVQYLPNPRDIVSLDGNVSRTRFEVPYDSTGGVTLNDEQEDLNAFTHVSWRHRFGAPGDGTEERARELFSALLYRGGSLTYTPGPGDTPSFIFYPDTVPYNLREDRDFSAVGAKVDYLHRVRHGLEFKAGALGSITTGHEKFQTFDASGQAGPTSDSDLNGHDFGVYAQAVVAPSDRIEIRPGVRFDTHQAPFAGASSQVSPRLRVGWYPDAGNSVWVYYGRLFIPTNIEDLRSITAVADSGVVAEPTVPERDDFYEVGYVHRFPAGVVGKLSAYHKNSNPGIDDTTVPGSAIVTSVNIDRIKTTGVEGVLEVKPPGPLSGYLNIALAHAYGHAPITGGFFPAATPEGDFDLDHDQRLSVVASATYAPRRLFVSVTGIQGSGLTNGQAPDASYGTGLFDFNRSIKVPASFILNASAGYTLSAGRTLVRPQLYVDNLFDNKYLLKGAFFSGASIGRPRSIVFKLELSL